MSERTFEDHENLVEPLLAWTRDSENKILFQERPEKNEVFKNPQVSPLVLCIYFWTQAEQWELMCVWWVQISNSGLVIFSWPWFEFGIYPHCYELNNICLISLLSLNDGVSFFHVEWPRTLCPRCNVSDRVASGKRHKYYNIVPFSSVWTSMWWERLMGSVCWHAFHLILCNIFWAFSPPLLFFNHNENMGHDM